MENGPYIDGLPIKNGDFPWQTVSHNQMVFRLGPSKNHGELLVITRCQGEVGKKHVSKNPLWVYGKKMTQRLDLGL